MVKNYLLNECLPFSIHYQVVFGPATSLAGFPVASRDSLVPSSCYSLCFQHHILPSLLPHTLTAFSFYFSRILVLLSSSLVWILLAWEASLLWDSQQILFLSYPHSYPSFPLIFKMFKFHMLSLLPSQLVLLRKTFPWSQKLCFICAPGPEIGLELILFSLCLESKDVIMPFQSPLQNVLGFNIFSICIPESYGFYSQQFKLDLLHKYPLLVPKP